MDITAIISICIACGSLVFVVLGFGAGREDKQKQRDQDEQTKISGIEKDLIKANMKLDQVCNSLNSIEKKLNKLEDNQSEQGKEIAMMKRDLETVWVRIDELKRGEYLPEYIKKGDDLK